MFVLFINTLFILYLFIESLYHAYFYMNNGNKTQKIMDFFDCVDDIDFDKFQMKKP